MAARAKEYGGNRVNVRDDGYRRRQKTLFCRESKSTRAARAAPLSAGRTEQFRQVPRRVHREDWYYAKGAFGGSKKVLRRVGQPSAPIDRVRRRRQRLPSILLIENVRHRSQNLARTVRESPGYLTLGRRSARHARSVSRPRRGRHPLPALRR